MYAHVLKAAVFVTVFLICVTGCQVRIPPEHRYAQPALATATPFPRVITRAPTETPLFRKSRISGQYGQHLVLYVGDTFTLDNLEGSISPVSYDPGILQMDAGPTSDFSEPKMFKAMKPGTTKVTADVAFPCPNAPAGCQPPEKDMVLVVVSVYEPSQTAVP